MTKKATAEAEEKQESIIEPGLYRDIDFDTYAEWDALNSQILTGLAATNPKKVRHHQLHGKKPTPAKDLGWLVHKAVLEPEWFEGEVVVHPKLDKRTKVGKATWAKFEATHAGKEIVDADTHEKVKAMAASAMEHPTARELLSGPGQNELSIVWNDRKHGIKCKARIDRVCKLNEWPVVVDVKSTKNAKKWNFERDLMRYGYHIQAAHYLEGLETLFPVPQGNPYRRFALVLIESEAPYCCACYEIEEASLDEGAKRREGHLLEWRDAVASGHYQGYSDGMEYVSLPAYAFDYIPD